MARKTKTETRKKRHRSLRKRIAGTAERPRLVVFRSARHIYAQVIDDLTRQTVASASDLLPKKPAAGTTPPSFSGKKAAKAKQVGALLAKICIDKGIKRVVFDRGGYKYHGRVSAVAAGAREGGLEF